MEWLKSIFLFNESHPLIFTRLNFWIFFIAVLFGYTYVYRKNPLRNIYLLVVSLFFYYKTGGLFFFILLFSIIANYLLGFPIYRSQNTVYRRLMVALSILVNLGVLGFFKYDYFFTETFNQIFNTDFEVITHAAKWSNQLFNTHFDLDKILPPVGISFFTFQTLSYTLDVYKRKVEPAKSLTDFGFYVSFFPQLVAGPIVRASEFIPQLYKNYSVTPQEFGMGFYMILKGLVKKILIGDFIAVNLIDRVFANPSSYSGFENLTALFGYSVQVYCDFSGYTDIAIGIALLLGFYLPKNFNSPYKAKNVGDFWKRWHMSLSSWLKDYLYIPMGGNRKGSLFTYISLFVILVFIILIARSLVLIPVFLLTISLIWLLTIIFPTLKRTITTNINILLTMLLGGLWHGSSWMFVLWGGLNGLGVIVYKFWRKISPYENSNHWLANTWKIAFTFTFITFTRIWFRGESMQGTYDLLKQITGNFGWSMVPVMALNYWKVLLLMVFAMVIHLLPDRIKEKYRNWFIVRPLYQQIGICVVVVFIIYQSASASLQPFIYFQF